MNELKQNLCVYHMKSKKISFYYKIIDINV